MKKIVLSLMVMIVAASAMAQIKDPVKWSTTSKKKGDIYEVTISASLPKPWHIYSQFTGEGGALPTTLKFSPNPLVVLSGGVKEVGKMKEQYDKNFDTKVKYFSDKVDFVQNVKVKNNLKTNVSVTVQYMTCDDSQCLPPTKKTFNVAL